jgi:ribonuclease E
MVKRMLIDASHPEETRVVVLNGTRLEEFDYESAARSQLKGNIYLAKITRVEPSLQAAFVEYGGNRHGFLPFSEIHPDYYRIPIADREALLAEQARYDDEAVGEEPDEGNEAEGGDDAPASAASPADSEQQADDDAQASGGKVEEIEVETSVDTVGGDEVEDDVRKRAKLLRRYKIQEVIKRRQVMLVLSLAGRYCVLMPNTARGGGISRKIGSASDRRRLKKVISEFDIPDGMAVIVRTAGSERTKVEIKRDYEYLMRLWSEIRETTLQSTAPALVHEEANLIKRAIRDLYSRDMDEILVDGEDGYKSAKAFMKNLMPSHARHVKLYKDPSIPLYYRFKVEGQIDAMHSPSVQLKSGGSIVINPTEALVAIDVNSGKATRERHIEETALKTNIEAADEVARQLRLRDLAGLIVIDFIDMEESRHNRDVERRFKDAMRHDRARIQFGRISPFGLLEMSRQRLRPSLFETSTELCGRCGGTGALRSTDSTALHVLRVLEEEGIRRGGGELNMALPSDVALYLLNDRRTRLTDIEQRYGLKIRVERNDTLVAPDYDLERLSTTGPAVLPAAEAVEEPAEDGEDRKRRGRRRRRRKDEEPGVAAEPLAEAAAGDGETAEEEAPADEELAAGRPERDEAEEERKPRRRRGKRGGRRRSKRRRDAEEAETMEAAGEAAPEIAPGPGAETAEAAGEPPAEAEAAEPAAVEAAPAETQPTEAKPEAEAAPAKPRKPRRRTRKAAQEAPPAEAGEAVEAAEAAESVEAVDATAGGPGAPAGAEAESEAKPARKPRRRTATKKPAAGTRAKSPARKTRKPKAAKPETPPGGAPETDGAAATAGNGEQGARAPAPPEPPRPAVGPAPDQAAAPNSAAPEAADLDRPKRRGWWQRFV